MPGSQRCHGTFGGRPRAEVERARRFDLEQRRRSARRCISIHKCDARRTFYDPGVQAWLVVRVGRAGPLTPAGGRRRHTSPLAFQGGRPGDSTVSAPARSIAATYGSTCHTVHCSPQKKPTRCAAGPTRAREAGRAAPSSGSASTHAARSTCQRLALLRRQRRRRDAHGAKRGRGDDPARPRPPTPRTPRGAAAWRRAALWLLFFTGTVGTGHRRQVTYGTGTYVGLRYGTVGTTVPY